MHINGARPEFTAAGIRNVAAAGTPQHCAQKNNRRTHLLHQCLRNGIRTQIAHAHRHGMLLHHTAAAQMGQNPAGGKYIRQPGTILQNRLTVTEQCPCQNRQSAVFCSVQKDLSLQRYAALNHQFLQSASPLFIFSVCGCRKMVKRDYFVFWYSPEITFQIRSSVSVISSAFAFCPISVRRERSV